MLALAVACALALQCGFATAAADSPPDAIIPLLPALKSARLAEPELAARVLTDTFKLGGSDDGVWLADLQAFDGPEREEMLEVLRGEGVGLADRSKLRRLIDLSRSTPDSYAKDIDNHRANDATIAAPRRMQKEELEADKGSGLSSDSIAIIITAVLGVGSFLVQARVAAAAEKTQRELELATSNHVRLVTTHEPFDQSLRQPHVWFRHIKRNARPRLCIIDVHACASQEKERALASVRLDRVRLQVCSYCVCCVYCGA
jgi:hypothetical protein